MTWVSLFLTKSMNSAWFKTLGLVQVGGIFPLPSVAVSNAAMIIRASLKEPSS
jgi:hypothetical protein